MSENRLQRAGNLKGIIPPMATPFDSEGEIDEAAFRQQVRFLIGHGVHGLAVGGSPGPRVRPRTAHTKDR